MAKPFLTVCPRSKKYLDYNVEAVPLRVELGDVDASPDVDIKANKLATGFRQFVNNSAYSDSFKIDVIIHRDDKVKGTEYFSLSDVTTVKDVDLTYLNKTGDGLEFYTELSLLTILDYWIKHAEPLYVTTRAIGIKNDLYLITENSSRKQSHMNYVVWSLEFMRYKDVPDFYFNNDNAVIKSTIEGKKKSSSKTTSSKKTTTTKVTETSFKEASKIKNTSSSVTTYRQKLAKCNINNLKYSKTKKVVECVKTMQHLLVHYGCLDSSGVDGWFGNDTKEAVKKFQKKYQKKYNLTVNGFVNGPTRDAMVKAGSISNFKASDNAKQIGNTIVIK